MSTFLPNRPTLTLLFFLVLLNFYLFHRLLRQPVLDLPPTAITTPTPSPSSSSAPTIPTTTPPSDPLPTPTETKKPIPLKLWQKTGPKGLTPLSESYIATWRTLNPSLRHEILSDASSSVYVDTAYKETWPSIASLYHAIQVPIVKADLLRLLILYADGGIWSDLDVGCEIPLSSWSALTPSEQDTEGLDMIVGLEFDGWQFASWTVLSRAGSVHMKAAIEYVAGQVEGIAERNNVTVEGVTMEMIPDVVDASGPQALTLAVLGSLSRGLGERVGRMNITGVREPRLLGDVLVLPQAAFAARQGGYPSDQGPYLVSHHYAGSWKNEVGGE
ncbi:hypothetical protein BO94DRAFT_114621 [Aspergillus sclerotioniger CBS 115572]|uniref:Initiation-specific alpha-1,6-mannosyltransferase n=1 Tax=Aspergillus sclerotioniger CBS 115572 TaxID=1450535 RepID=A0A317WEX1_9EURO|nr:hypothetical protein BO94DRAFT_114621 [Aspergillus sclerotioniger CBS 115572]PWY83772.1 hypothetical protein BO94DRAFT_114621 [Aspergillus sclerotioniger CBS 115572]